MEKKMAVVVLMRRGIGSEFGRGGEERLMRRGRRRGGGGEGRGRALGGGRGGRGGAGGQGGEGGEGGEGSGNEIKYGEL